MASGVTVLYKTGKLIGCLVSCVEKSFMKFSADGQWHRNPQEVHHQVLSRSGALAVHN
jgi:hypothetical protein